MNYCGLNKPAKVFLPSKSDDIVELESYIHSVKVSFAVYKLILKVL